MFILYEHDDPNSPTGLADVAAFVQNKSPLKDMLFAGIQVVGGASLAFYTYENSSRIWPCVYSAVAWGGAYNMLRTMRKIFWRSSSNDGNETCSLNNVATGTIIYFGSLYAFSEAWRIDHDLWKPFLGSAALGFFYAVSSTYSDAKTTYTQATGSSAPIQVLIRKRVHPMNPILKCCQLSFGPALLVGGATYLLYFRNHEEDWMYWFPMVATGFTGFEMAMRAMYASEDNEEDRKILILQGVEMLMGGCFLTFSSIGLGIYVSIKEIYGCWKPYTLSIGSFGAYVIMGGITCITSYSGVDDQVAVCIGSMLLAPVFIFVACLFVKWTEHKRVARALFPFMAGGGCFLLLGSVLELNRRVPRPVFIKYIQRAWGPMLIVSGSAASVYIGYRFGWNSRYFQLMTPLVAAGIYVTYKGYSRMDES